MTNTKLLTDFLSKNGLTVDFIVRLKKERGIKSVEEYLEWFKNTKWNLRLAFYIAFKWDKEDEIPWRIHEGNWIKHLDSINYPRGPFREETLYFKELYEKNKENTKRY